jgi:hypothetical protein
VTKRKATPRGLTVWQRRALADLRAQARKQPTLLSVDKPALTDDGLCRVEITVNTTDITPVDGGLRLRDHEVFTIALWPEENLPPAVYVSHARFLGQPHVLSGHNLCLYLDPAREWDPGIGINGKDGVLDRLWRWLTDAAHRNFHPDTALYHAVGGVPHITSGTPVIVVRDLPEPKARVANAYSGQRSEFRLDVRVTRTEPAGEHVPVFYTDTDMPFGAGRHYLVHLLLLVNYPDLGQRRVLGYEVDRRATEPPTIPRPPASSYSLYSSGSVGQPADETRPVDLEPELDLSPAAALFVALGASAARKPDGTPQYLILAVPHPNGGPRHLLAIRLSADIADELRRVVRTRAAALIDFDLRRLNPQVPMEWCYVSDERAAVTTRRDTARPITAFLDRTVVVWGCGGIGSWVAEYIARAGAGRLILCDNGIVTGGLLVRQNYLESDIGDSKARSLAYRLSQINDDLEVEAHGAFTRTQVQDLVQQADVIVDATISRTVTRQLDAVTSTPRRRALIAQVATDTRTGSLGLVTISEAEDPTSLTTIDKETGRHVKSAGALEPFHLFWEEPLPGDEITPTRGCSVPTFHGSAADLAAVAASLTSMIAQHLKHPATGTHLVALPHSGVTPAHTYVPRSGSRNSHSRSDASSRER